MIDDERISAIGSDLEVPGDAEVIEAAGLTLLPGLMDAHLHLFGIKGYDFGVWAMESPKLHAIRSAIEIQEILGAGYTLIRDCGSDHALELKRAVEEGTINGPRMRAVGRFIAETGGIPDLPFIRLDWMQGPEPPGFVRLADGVAEVTKAAREQIRGGATDIKLGVTGGIDPSFIRAESAWTEEEIAAAVHVAHNVGAKISAHSNVLLGGSCVGMQRAIRAGVDSIEHGYWVDDETLEMMVENEVTWNPNVGYLARAAERGEDLNLNPVYVERCKIALESFADTLPRAKSMGVSRAIGSDFLGTPADPHGEEAFELEVQTRHGLTPMEALVTATKGNAEFFGIDEDLGTLEVGKVADLFLIDGDPLADIRVLQERSRIKMVMVGGETRVTRP
ncbi:MAG: amidohydrolase family protein [Acidimicrobiia bacterium]